MNNRIEEIVRGYAVLLCLLGTVKLSAQGNVSIGKLSRPGAEPDVMNVLTDPWSGLDAEGWNAGSFALPDSVMTGNGLFYVDLQIRGRGEYRNGQGTLRETGQKPAWFVNDRERISLGYGRGMLSARVSGQHAGVWGDQGLRGTQAGFYLNEAWARLDVAKGWFLQVGRQSLSYDDERIFGEEDWQTTGFSHDALRFGYESFLNKVHGVLGFNQQGEKRIGGTYYNGAMPYKSMQMLWYHYGNDNRPFQFSLMGMNLGLEIGVKSANVEIARTGYMQMVGGWFQYASKGAYAKAEGYYQLGHDQDQRKMDAFLTAMRIGYKAKRWGACIGGDYVSGSKSSIRRGTNHCFNLLYGSTHDFYGAMDFFVQGTMLSCGLIDGLATAYVEPLSRFTLKADYHGFLMAVKRNNVDRLLGHEVDFHLRYDLHKDVSLEMGYGFLLPQKPLAYFRGGNPDLWHDWGWLSINFSPRIFSFRTK